MVFARVLLVLYTGKGNSEKSEPGRKKIIFTSQDVMWKEVKDYNTDNVRKSDAFYDSTIRILRETDEYELLGVSLDYTNVWPPGRREYQDT